MSGWPDRCESGRRSTDGSIYRSRELLLVVTASLALLLAGWLALAALDRHSDLLLLDLREWRLSASPHPASPRFADVSYERFARSLRPRQPSRRPFRLTLEFPGYPRRGRFVAAEGLYQVDPGESYCFEIWTWSPYVNPDSEEALETFRVIASVNGEAVTALPIADTDQARRIVVRGIEPEGDRIRLRVEVRSFADRLAESWRRASRTHFEYASLRRCPDGR